MNDLSEAPRMIWARKGEVVTCIKGHPICAISRDIYVGEARMGNHFTDWQQREPDRSASVAEIRCERCRGVWLRGNPKDGYAFHFSEGWR
jgi:hypothetical protein